MKHKLTIGVSLALVLAMLFTVLALADTVTPDADVVTTGDQPLRNLGNVAPGATLTPQVSFKLECAGNKHVDNGQTVNLTFTPAGSTVPSDGSLSATTASIGVIPLAWPDDGNNCPGTPPTPLNDNGNSTVTITAPTTAGTYTYKVKYDVGLTPAGVNDSASVSGSVDATFTLTVVSDTTPPVITPNISGTAGSNGWYTSNVSISWTVEDPESTITSQTGCGSSTQTTETTGTTFTCAATSAGGTASNSVIIKLDKTGPTAALAVTAGTLGTNDWYTSDVTVSTSGEDDVSSPVTCTADQYQTDETTGTVFNGSCTNDAGLTTNAAPLTVKLDKTGPTAALAVTAGTLGTNDWYTSDVTVSTSGEDDVSSPVTCTADQYQTDETTGTVFNGSCTNDAGLTTDAAPLTIKLDKTGPSAALAVTDGALGSNGWYTSDVTVSTSGSDSISDPVTCTGDQFQTTDTAGTVFNGSCTNDAGLTTNADPLTVMLDKTPPSITWNGGPAAGGSYYFGFVPAAPTCTAADDLSGPDGCNVDGYATTVGSHTMTATAYDVAGNSKVETRTYTVLAWTLTGFYQPVDMNGVYNVVKNGSTVPLKFEIFAGLTELTDVAYVKSLTYAQTGCSATAITDEIETVATGGTVLRYDSTGGQFIFNWKTPSTAGKCYRVTMTTQDGSSLVAYFKLK